MLRLVARKHSLIPSRSEAGSSESAAGGLAASGQRRISRHLGGRRLGAGSDGDPDGLPTSGHGESSQQAAPKGSPDA